VPSSTACAASRLGSQHYHHLGLPPILPHCLASPTSPCRAASVLHCTHASFFCYKHASITERRRDPISTYLLYHVPF